MADNEGPVTVTDLPMTFQVKYLGQSDARGLWGIKHTRKPVDLMVAAAKALPPGQILPIVKLTITVVYICFSNFRNAARRLTYSLAAAFQDYSRRVKEMQANPELDERPPSLKKRFAIDLRTPEEIEAELETEA
ncbi:jg4894 [Pararge aegeria aegeria]|uniref:Jg4894 protein n=1 Tax=Pararge aegeria aegeria TaxID=348720 RepID=A0A8S4RMR0_9NEOP|nr:jg4894 [Pararge aegeria aegeria]